MQPKSPPNPGRRKFLISATSAVGAVGVAGAVVPFISAFNPSAAAEAAGAPAVADIGKLAPGEMIIVEWRGTPIYVVKHTDESIKEIDKNLERLADPNSETQVQPDYAKNKYRSRKPGISVLSAVCTHLGCAPMYRPDVGAADLGGDAWLGGFFCPCHGSTFDMSGRVFVNVPAPTNLEIPPHSYESDDVLVIGVDSEVA